MTKVNIADQLNKLDADPTSSEKQETVDDVVSSASPSRAIQSKPIDKDALIAQLYGQLEEAKSQAKVSFTVENIQPIKEKYSFFISHLPGAGYPLNNNEGDIITFTPRSTVVKDPTSGHASTGSIVGEFWTKSPELAKELDAVQNGIRRMSDDEIIRCLDAQIT